MLVRAAGTHARLRSGRSTGAAPGSPGGPADRLQRRRERELLRLTTATRSRSSTAGCGGLISGRRSRRPRGRRGGRGLRAGRRRPAGGHPRAHRPLRPGRAADGADRCRAGDAHDDGPGLREVPPPETARARRRDTYADHGVSEDERGDHAHHLTRWLPYLHSVVEASTAAARWGGPGDRRRDLAGRAHARALARPRLPVVPGAPDTAVRRPPAARHHPAGDLRARVRRGPAAQLPDVAAGRRRPAATHGAAGPRHAVR